MNDLRKTIWEAIKDWDINTPEYSGYCKATGSHVDTIFNAIQALAQPKPVAWMTDDGFYELEPEGVGVVPLYTAPPSIEAAVLAEREACAKVADGFIGADPIAAAIRARGEK